MVAVVKEKHLKRVSSCEEEFFIEQVRSALESMPFLDFLAADNDQQNALKSQKLSFSIMSKWLDSMERNSQRYLANAIRGRFVIDLICDYKKKRLTCSSTKT